MSLRVRSAQPRRPSVKDSDVPAAADLCGSVNHGTTRRAANCFPAERRRPSLGESARPRVTCGSLRRLSRVHPSCYRPSACRSVGAAPKHAQIGPGRYSAGGIGLSARKPSRRPRPALALVKAFPALRGGFIANLWWSWVAILARFWKFRAEFPQSPPFVRPQSCSAQWLGQ